MKDVIINLNDNQLSIIERVGKLLFNYKYKTINKLSIEDLFIIIDELSSEVDRLQEELEEK